MENKNVILAIVLSAAIMIVWMVFIQPHFFPQPTPQQAAQQAQQGAAQPGQQAAPQDAGRKVVSREEALKESPRVAIDSPRLKGSINLKGARLDDLVLKDYRETVEPDEPQHRAAVAARHRARLLCRLRLARRTPRSRCRPRTRSGKRMARRSSPDKPLTLTWDNGQGLTFARKFEIDPDYMFTVTDTVTNASGAPGRPRAVRPGGPLRHAEGRQPELGPA